MKNMKINTKLSNELFKEWKIEMEKQNRPENSYTYRLFLEAKIEQLLHERLEPNKA